MLGLGDRDLGKFYLKLFHPGKMIIEEAYNVRNFITDIKSYKIL